MIEIVVHYTPTEYRVLANYLKNPNLATDPISQRVLKQIKSKMDGTAHDG